MRAGIVASFTHFFTPADNTDYGVTISESIQDFLRMLGLHSIHDPCDVRIYSEAVNLRLHSPRALTRHGLAVRTTWIVCSGVAAPHPPVCDFAERFLRDTLPVTSLRRRSGAKPCTA